MTSRPSGSPSILSMAWPLILSFWMRSLFQFVDMLYARTIGDEAVAGIGVAAPFEFLMVALWVGTSTGMTSLLSRAFGAREGERAEQIMRITKRIVAVVIPVYALLGVAIWFVAPHLVRATAEGPGLTEGVAYNFRIYGTVIVVGSAFTSFWSVIPDSIVKAHHDTRATMWAGIWSNLVNVALNTLFTFVFHWGIFGIAFSTVIGRIAGLVYAQRRAAAHERERLAAGLDTVPGTYDRPLAAMFALSVPAALAYSLVAFESFVVNFLLARSPHVTEATAAYSIWSRWLYFLTMPMIATAVAMLPFTARMRGEGDIEGIRRALRQVLFATCGYILIVVAPISVLAPGLLVRPFATGALTRELAMASMTLLPLACLAATPFFLCRPVFEGFQMGRPGLMVAVLRYVVLTPLLALAGSMVAEGAGLPAFFGILVALLLAAMLSSTVFVTWMVRMLSRSAGSGSA